MKKIWDLLVVAPCLGGSRHMDLGIHMVLGLLADSPSGPDLAAGEPAARSPKLDFECSDEANLLDKEQDHDFVLGKGVCSGRHEVD